MKIENMGQEFETHAIERVSELHRIQKRILSKGVDIDTKSITLLKTRHARSLVPVAQHLFDVFERLREPRTT